MSSSNFAIIIGVSGVTCGGKTQLATLLCEELMPKVKYAKISVLCQDDYFLPESDSRHIWIEELNHINFDVISSLDMAKLYNDVLKIIGNCEIIKEVGTTMDNLKHIVIVEGFSVFMYKPLLRLFTLRYYFLLEKEECRRRRIQRIYDPPDCPGYFDYCAWPEHLKQLHQIRSQIKEHITYFNTTFSKSSDASLKIVLKDINKLVILI